MSALQNHAYSIMQGERLGESLLPMLPTKGLCLLSGYQVPYLAEKDAQLLLTTLPGGVDDRAQVGVPDSQATPRALQMGFPSSL